jgi:hypothetical protein
MSHQDNNEEWVCTLAANADSQFRGSLDDKGVSEEEIEDEDERDELNGPKGRPNNLPQPAWRLAELFFRSDLS